MARSESPKPPYDRCYLQSRRGGCIARGEQCQSPCCQIRSTKPSASAKVKLSRKKKGLVVGLFVPLCAAGRRTLWFRKGGQVMSVQQAWLCQSLMFLKWTARPMASKFSSLSSSSTLPVRLGWEQMSCQHSVTNCTRRTRI